MRTRKNYMDTKCREQTTWNTYSNSNRRELFFWLSLFSLFFFSFFCVTYSSSKKNPEPLAIGKVDNKLIWFIPCVNVSFEQYISPFQLLELHIAGAKKGSRRIDRKNMTKKNHSIRSTKCKQRKKRTMNDVQSSHYSALYIVLCAPVFFLSSFLQMFE